MTIRPSVKISAACMYLFATNTAAAFQMPSLSVRQPATIQTDITSLFSHEDGGEEIFETKSTSELQTRRSALSNTAKSILASYALVNTAMPMNNANAAVGTIPEFSDTNAVLQGLTVDVADRSQFDEMIAFMVDGFSGKILRQSTSGPVSEVWVGFGPEEMNIPDDFELPVSSFSKYGGHSSIHIRYDSQITEAFYRKGQDAPGDNIAYVQVGVQEYRISQMVKNGGNIIDAYGIVNVVSPSGLPFRGIIGISPDPIMFIAINCASVNKSSEFYKQLGFTQQEYPYCRPNKGMGQFEPLQPKGSVYLAPSKNSVGVLLLPVKKKNVKPNPVLRSLNIVYQASEGTAVDPTSDLMIIADPSTVPIAFQPYEVFEALEKKTRVIPEIEEAVNE